MSLQTSLPSLKPQSGLCKYFLSTIPKEARGRGKRAPRRSEGHAPLATLSNEFAMFGSLFDKLHSSF